MSEVSMIKKAIVTGANGFVGLYVTRELIKNGVEVIAVVRDYDSDIRSISGLDGIRIVVCDMANYGKLQDIVKDKDIDVIYHFAWLGSAGPLRNDTHVQCANIENSCTLLDSCKEMDIKRFIFASSIMEYELLEHEKKGTIEKSTIYSAAKLATNFMLEMKASSCGIEYIRTVISNVYGPEEKSPRLINSSIRKMLNNEHCAFSDGEQMYDFIYCTDAARAYFAIGENGIPGKEYYIGSLKPKKLKCFLTQLRDCVDSSIQIGLGELPPIVTSCDYDRFDIEAVKRDTGVEPEISFEEGISNTIEWLKGHMGDGIYF